jgi:hypothetical protein
MRTHRFGRKIKLPSTIAIKHQIRKQMFEDALKQAAAAARADSGHASIPSLHPLNTWPENDAYPDLAFRFESHEAYG